jgi:phytoene dehydrogenase-like protein
VEQVIVEGGKVRGVVANGQKFISDVVVSDADINLVYGKLLEAQWSPKKLLLQEKSSSAYIFYWGIKKEFSELSMQNVLFSDNYSEEFKSLFGSDQPYHDPTVYIHISSKVCKADAPEGCENWFVMINVPHNRTHLPVNYSAELKSNVIKKINRVLKTDIEPLIVCEEILDPFTIETTTSSYGGSLYGNSSNNKYAAFLRHSNYSNKIKGLYFCGGSVHPGGGIPLCLLSAKIATGMVIKKYRN